MTPSLADGILNLRDMLMGFDSHVYRTQHKRILRSAERGDPFMLFSMRNLERLQGIEPHPTGWTPVVLPLTLETHYLVILTTNTAMVNIGQKNDRNIDSLK